MPTDFKNIIKSNHFCFSVFCSFSCLDTAVELIELYIIQSQLGLSYLFQWEKSGTDHLK